VLPLWNSVAGIAVPAVVGAASGSDQTAVGTSSAPSDGGRGGGRDRDARGQDPGVTSSYGRTMTRAPLWMKKLRTTFSASCAARSP
jgi:hypothetical protein